MCICIEREIYTHTVIHTCIYVYVCISLCLSLSLSLFIYIYIYICIHITIMQITITTTIIIMIIIMTRKGWGGAPRGPSRSRGGCGARTRFQFDDDRAFDDVYATKLRPFSCVKHKDICPVVRQKPTCLAPRLVESRASSPDMTRPGAAGGLGRHYLSNATRLTRPLSFYAFSAASGISMICCVVRHFLTRTCVDKNMR